MMAYLLLLPLNEASAVQSAVAPAARRLRLLSSGSCYLNASVTFVSSEQTHLSFLTKRHMLNINTQQMMPKYKPVQYLGLWLCLPFFINSFIETIQ